MKIVLTLVVLVVGLFLLGNAVFILREGEQAIVTQFGEIVRGPLVDAGLYWKTPFVQKVHRFEKRILEWDGDPDRIPTRDKKFIFIDSTARWRISDPIKFFKSVRTMRNAIDRLNDIIDAAVRDQISQYNLIEVVRSTNHISKLPKDLLVSLSQEVRVEIKAGQDVILENVRREVHKLTQELDLGIEVIDIRIKGLNYDSQEVRRRVYDRMIAERRRIAALYLSEGRGKKAEISGEMEKKLRQIRSQAYQTAQTIRGKADAEATRIYAEAYTRDPEFFAFLRTMETYKKVVRGNHVLIISTDSPLYRYWKRLSGQRIQ